VAVSHRVPEPPRSPGAIAYYQQVGRAGRALPQAPVVLLRSPEDRDIQDYFIGRRVVDGGLVRKGREAGEFSEALVEAAAELVGKRWRPDPFPTWVTCVPSTRHPDLVPLFAERLAKALELPFLPVLLKTRETAPQAEMENSQQQLANVWGAFSVEASEVPADQSVLLVDDLQDSRWTLTVVGAALLEAGSGPVSPFVLAKPVSD
jgi:ATP-dependent DNA helicase RecQ